MDKCDYCTNADISCRKCTKCYVKYRLCSTHIGKSICNKCSQASQPNGKTRCNVCNTPLSIYFESTCPKCKKQVYLCDEHITSLCKQCLPVQKIETIAPILQPILQNEIISAGTTNEKHKPCDICKTMEDELALFISNKCFTKTHQMLVCPTCVSSSLINQECPLCKKFNIKESIRCYIGTFMYNKVLLWNPVADFWTLNDIEFLEDTKEDMIIPDNNATVPLHRINYQALVTGGYDPIKNAPVADCYLISSTPYDILTAEKTNSLAVPRFLHCAEIEFNVSKLENIVFIMGGLCYGPFGKKWINECEKFIISDKQITQADMAPMIESRSQFATCMLKQKIYAMGGYCGNNLKPANQIECYDIIANKWTAVQIANSVIPNGLCLQQLLVANDEIIILGGSDGEEFSNCMYKYSPATGKAIGLSPMLAKRAAFSALEDNGMIYACYGTGNGNMYCEKYENGSWSNVREWINDLAGCDDEEEIDVSDLISSHFKIYI